MRQFLTLKMRRWRDFGRVGGLDDLDNFGLCDYDKVIVGVTVGIVVNDVDVLVVVVAVVAALLVLNLLKWAILAIDNVVVEVAVHD